MTLADLYAILPIVLLAVTAVAIMLAAAFRGSHTVAAVLSIVGVTASLLAVLGEVRAEPRAVTPLLVVDGLALFFMALILCAALVVIILSHSYLAQGQGSRAEFYILVLLATLGSLVLVVSNHFASFFLGLEILSVALYGLIAYLRTREQSVEAGLKYLVLAAASSAFLLFGMALVYADLGSMAFDRIASAQVAAQPRSILLGTGLAMTIVGIGFKLAVVPFHMWTPDVYEGAPAPVAAFVATVSKGAVLGLAIRYLSAVDIQGSRSLLLTLTVISIASMLAGSLLALLQNNVKRILAYASIAHMGYMLVAFVAGGNLGGVAVAFYLAAYFAATLGAFGIVSALSGPERDADATDDYRGLFWRRPWLAGLFTFMLLSFAGIPLTAGFLGKFYVLSAGVGTSLWLLVLTLVASSVIGLYYYLRLIYTMFLPIPGHEVVAKGTSLSWMMNVTLAVLGLIVLWLGIYPNLLIKALQAVTTGLL